MTEENRTYITHLKVTDVPWHRLTTAYGRGTDFPAHLTVLEQMRDLASVKESLYELTTNMEHQSTLWHATPFGMVFLSRILEKALADSGQNPAAHFLAGELLDFFSCILQCFHDGDEMEHAEALPLFSDLLKEEYLWSEEYDEEEDEMRYEEDEVFPDDLFYSFYYYSWQAVLAYDHVVKDRPLTFLAQFNCEELAQFDKEHLLPDHGLLSFFYETDTQCWGYDPKDKGCARVYWFEDLSALSAANFPADMEEDFKFPMVKIKMDSKYSYPSWQDFSEMFPDEEDDDAFNDAWEELTGEDPEDPDDRSQLLGWPDVIQNSMFDECDLASQGYYLGDGNGWNKIPKTIRQQAEETARDRWMLLFQMDTVELGDFELMFGDCGHIYFYITKEDLAARRFDRIWLILQCY